MKKIVVSWIFCVLALVAVLMWLGRDVFPKAEENSEASLIDGKFTLASADGKTVTDKNFRGRYMLIYFGYTHCPDMCPTALLLMQNALSHVGPLAEKIQPIFVSLDPARDTPKITNDYASHFGGAMLGLSGTPMQIKQMADNYKVYYSSAEDQESALGYSVDHSGFMYLMGPDGHFITHFAYNVSERELEEGLRRYVH